MNSESRKQFIQQNIHVKTEWDKIFLKDAKGKPFKPYDLKGDLLKRSKKY